MSKEKRNSRKVLRELRKAKADLAALISYEEECRSLLDDYSSEWNKDFSIVLTVFDREQKKDSSTKIQKDFFDTADDEPTEKEVDHSQSPDWVKKAFRKLALKTHPDKTSEDPNSKQLLEAYSKANAAIESKDYDSFKEICQKFDIKIDLEPKVELEINVKRQKDIRDKIKKIESSLPWIWGESYGDDQSRKNILLAILPHFGISSFDENAVNKIIEKIHSS